MFVFNRSADATKWPCDYEAPEGKLDLLMTADFRMTSSTLLSDIVFPAATWYEKHDISTTDMHPFINSFNQAIAPPWETRTDYEIFQTLAGYVSEMAKTHLGTRTDLLAAPLNHDTPDAIQEPRLWSDGRWTARVIKNEDDDGWAVAMIKEGEAEPALVGPWTMGRDKKNPKPLDGAALPADADAALKHEAHTLADRMQSLDRQSRELVYTLARDGGSLC